RTTRRSRDEVCVDAGAEAFQEACSPDLTTACVTRVDTIYLMTKSYRDLEPVIEPPFLEGDLAPVPVAAWAAQRHLRFRFCVEVAACETGPAVSQLDPAVAVAVEYRGRRLAFRGVSNSLCDDLGF